jgi:NADH-quinone oxidoreductase subunit J
MVGIFIIGIIMLAAAVAVIVVRQPVHSALALIGVTIGLAMIYLILQAEFLAVAQVIVYAGAIMVLFLFVVTLLTAGKEDTEGVDTLSGQRWAGTIAGLAIGVGLAIAIATHKPVTLSTALSGSFGGLHPIGQELWGPYFPMLAGVALMLLTAVMGVLTLNRPEAPQGIRARRLPAGVTLSEPDEEGKS